MMRNYSALLALDSGEIFYGHAIGKRGVSGGEIVFNTAMVGYQEILTDPSYHGQIVTFTTAHVGVTGINNEDDESSQMWASGAVFRDAPAFYSSWRATGGLDQALQHYGVCGIAGIDTRKLTRLLRDGGARNACIMSESIDAEKALQKARAWPSLKGMDLAYEVTTKSPYLWCDPIQSPSLHIVVYDFGIKLNALRMMSQRGAKITVVPATTSAKDVLALRPQGVYLSNGPGDPEPCTYAIAAIREILQANVPIFGVCLGHQLLALAAGAKTMKMKFGHHGSNHPVKDLQSGRVLITSQNHGFCVDASSLPDHVEVTHVSLFDHTLQGIRLKDRLAFSLQGHPEASPGPQDGAYLFDQFFDLIQKTHA
jgi:carbamoyl-phosphate synthase small subunit